MIIVPQAILTKPLTRFKRTRSFLPYSCRALRLLAARFRRATIFLLEICKDLGFVTASHSRPEFQERPPGDEQFALNSAGTSESNDDHRSGVLAIWRAGNGVEPVSMFTYRTDRADPYGEARADRLGCNIISAVNNLGKMQFRVFKGSFTQLVMMDFLDRLIRDAKRKVIVIVDGHPAHRGRRLQQWLQALALQCELVLLPGYAPKLNPGELLNQDLKSNVFSSGRPRTRDELVAQTRSYLRATQKRPDIVRAYSQEA